MIFLRDQYDPDRFVSGDALRDYLASVDDVAQQAALAELNWHELRPYVVRAILKMTTFPFAVDSWRKVRFDDYYRTLSATGT